MSTRGLAGDFATMPLKELVAFLGQRRASGTLYLDRGTTQKQILLRDGMVVGASSNEAREFLGQFLINMGHITEEQFTRAYETQLETRVFLGKILVMTGAVTEETLRTALSLKFRETVLDAFVWADGSFRYDPTVQTPALQGVEFEVELLDLHREGEFRETAWQAIRGAFPTGGVRLQLFEQNFPEPPREGTLDERIVSLIKYGLTIDEIKLALHATDFFLFQRLYALYRLDVVRPEDASEVDVQIDEDEPLSNLEEPLPGVELSADELFQAARSAADEGDAREAELLARRAYELTPTPAAAALLARTETMLLEALRPSLMTRGVKPRLRIAPEQVRTLKLTAPERYLLSRVDGHRDIHTIVTVSPLRELEALKLIRGLIESGHIGIDEG